MFDNMLPKWIFDIGFWPLWTILIIGILIFMVIIMVIKR